MKKTAQKIRGTLSIERFNHFQCGECKSWWGIGDAPRRTQWYCPWCGTKQFFTDNP